MKGLQDELTQRLQNGDVSAFEELYNAYAKGLYAYLYAMTQSKELSEDAVSDAFLKLYGHIAAGKEIGNIKALLYVTARNLLYDRLRQSKRLTPISEDIAAPSGEQDDGIALKAALQSIPPDEREIVTLHIYSGFKHCEIAAMLGFPESTVRWKYRRALQKLKERLGECYA